MQNKKADRWMPWVLLAGMPLLFLPDATDPYGTIRWAALGGLAAFLWVRARGQWQAWILAVDRRVLWAMVAFHVMGLVSLLGAIHPLEGLWDVCRWLMVCGLMLGLAGVLRDNVEAKQAVWRAGSVAGLLLGCIWLLQAAKVLDGIPEGGDPTAATLGNPNFFAGAMAMLACCGIGTALNEGSIWRWVGLGSAALCAGLVWLAGSLGATLALGVGLVVLAEGGIIARWPGTVYARSHWMRGAVLAFAVIGLGVGFAWKILSAPTEIQVGGSSELERVLMWRKSLQMIGESPILGVGAGHWHYHILRLGAVSNFQGFATRYFMEAHNDYLQEMAERGVVGGLAFLLMLGGIWKGSWKKGSERGSASASASASENAKHFLGARMVLAVWMVFALTNLPGHQAYLMVFLAVFGAMMLADSTGKAPVAASVAGKTGTIGKGWGGLGIAFVVASTVILLLNALWMRADRANFKVIMAKGRKDWPKTQRLAAEAQAWYNPHDRVSGTPLIWYEGISLLSMGQAQAALPALQAAKQAHPYHPQVGSNLGVAYFMIGQHDRAIRELEELIARFPAFDEARQNLTEAYLTVGQRDKAAANIDYWRVHEGNPRYDDYYTKITALLQAPATP